MEEKIEENNGNFNGERNSLSTKLGWAVAISLMIAGCFYINSEQSKLRSEYQREVANITSAYNSKVSLLEAEKKAKQDSLRNYYIGRGMWNLMP